MEREGVQHGEPRWLSHALSCKSDFRPGTELEVKSGVAGWVYAMSRCFVSVSAATPTVKQPK